MIAVNLLISIIVIAVLQLFGMFIFNLVTPFNDMEELKKGNLAVGVSMGGKFLSTAVLIGVSAYTNSSIWHMILWFCVGFVCLVLTYWIFDWVTPNLKLSKELENGNVAVGVLLACVYVGIGFAVSSLII